MAKNQNTWAKRKREMDKKRKAEEKRELRNQRRQERKEGGPKVELEVVGLDEFGNVIEREVGGPDPRLVKAESESESAEDAAPDA